MMTTRIVRAAQRRSVGRLGLSEEVAEAVLFIARSPHINGTVLYVDGCPRFSEGRLYMFGYDPARIGERRYVVYDIEKRAIRRFARAVGETNPIYFEEAAARQAGYPSLVAPPTFPVTLARSSLPGLRMPPAGVIHGEQEFLLRAGDRITVSGWLADVHDVQGSLRPMTLLTLMTEGRHLDGTLAFQSRSVLIIPQGVA